MNPIEKSLWTKLKYMTYASFYTYGELVQNLYDNLNCIGKEFDARSCIYGGVVQNLYDNLNCIGKKFDARSCTYGEVVQNLYDNLNCIGKEVDPFKIYKHWRALLKKKSP